MEFETQSEESEICRIKGLDLILKSINCEKYKSKFTSHGINEYTMLHLTADDLKILGVAKEDMEVILSTVNILNKSLNLSEIRLSNDEIQKLQSNICGQLGSIALILNHIYCSLSDDNKHFNDILIDDHISSIDAALMVKPYLRAEEKNIENTLKSVYKMKKKRTVLITTVCTVLLFGFALGRLNYSLNTNSIYSKILSYTKS